MSRISAFYPALLVFAGAILVAFGGFLAALRQSNFNAEIRQKNEEIAHLQHEAANIVTGGDSFCWMQLSMSDGPDRPAQPVFVHIGQYPLYDVTARIVDVDAIMKAPSLSGSVDFGITLSIGNMTPGFAMITGTRLPQTSGSTLNYNVFFVARNGSWTQLIRMRRIEGGWVTATKVVSGMDHPKEVIREVNNGFPLNADGDVNWDEK
jgi:hypothetical protein